MILFVFVVQKGSLISSVSCKDRRVLQCNYRCAQENEHSAVLECWLLNKMILNLFQLYYIYTLTQYVGEHDGLVDLCCLVSTLFQGKVSQTSNWSITKLHFFEIVFHFKSVQPFAIVSL